MKLEAKPTAPATAPSTKPTNGHKKKYLDNISIDSIPTGMMVKKPNKPFKPLITNKSTLNAKYFALNNYVL
jgi:hypothetical protein